MRVLCLSKNYNTFGYVLDIFMLLVFVLYKIYASKKYSLKHSRYTVYVICLMCNVLGSRKYMYILYSIVYIYRWCVVFFYPLVSDATMLQIPGRVCACYCIYASFIIIFRNIISHLCLNMNI